MSFLSLKKYTANIDKNKITNYIKTALLPLALVFLFVLQNQEFNSWLKMSSDNYTSRLFAVTFGLGVVFYFPYLLFNQSKFKYTYLFLISFLISFVFSAQFLYYRYSESFLQISAIRYFGQAGSVMGTAKAMLTPELLLFIANIIIVLIAFLLTFRKKYTEFVVPKWEKLIIIIVIIVIAFSGYKYLIDKEKKEWGSTSRLYTDMYDLNAVIGKMGIINFSLEDTFKYIIRSNLVTAGDKNFLETWVKSKQVPESGTKYFGIAKEKNIIFIQVESLEDAVINQTIAGQEITPNLNQLAKDGLYFDNYYTQVGPGNTADAEFAILNSLYPLPDDVAFVDYAKNQYKALPQLLKSYGYGTYSFHGDVPTFWNRSNIYPGLGDDKAFDIDEYVVPRPVGEGPSDLGDEDFFTQSLPKLEKLKQPFMATMITISSHTPFILPDDLQTLQIPVETSLDNIQRNYLESIHYTDLAIGEFINGLKKNGLYSNSLILIYGDHGSYTNISTALGQDKNILPGLVSSQVPLIILAPETNLNGTINIPASHLDLYPTITNLLGIASPKSILGQDIFNAKNPVVTHFNLVSGGVNTILTSDMAFEENKDGIYEHGKCVEMPSQNPLPVANCKNLYNQQANNVKASDIIVRGNLLNILSTK